MKHSLPFSFFRLCCKEKFAKRFFLDDNQVTGVSVLSDYRTKYIYHVDGEGFHDGVDLPSHLSIERQEEVADYIALRAKERAIFFGSTVPIFLGPNHFFMTSILVYTNARGQKEGWNIVHNRRGQGEYEVKRIAGAGFAYELHNGSEGEIFYFACTEIPLRAATDPTLSEEELMKILAPSSKFLKSIVSPLLTDEST